MSRHSKNATATTHFTYHEKQAAGHGTLKRRFGKDSQLSFGFCCLCLANTYGNNPLVSPSGFLYCKECIYSSLLAQKRAIQENMLEYEKYCEKKIQEEQEEIIEKERKQLTQFLSGQGGSGITLETKESSDEKIKAKLTEKVDGTSIEDKRDAMKKTSFWIPDCTPTTKVKIVKPDTKTRDPMSHEEMKLKHLMPVKFEWDEIDKEKHVLCAVTKKAITHQQAVLLRPSGQVLLESCVKDMIIPTMTCPISGLKLRNKDIIKLQSGGTSFSAHSNVEAKKYRPTMT
jgi:nitric oxide synthase-interacting protein